MSSWLSVDLNPGPLVPNPNYTTQAVTAIWNKPLCFIGTSEGTNSFKLPFRHSVQSYGLLCSLCVLLALQKKPIHSKGHSVWLYGHLERTFVPEASLKELMHSKSQPMSFLWVRPTFLFSLFFSFVFGSHWMYLKDKVYCCNTKKQRNWRYHCGNLPGT